MLIAVLPLPSSGRMSTGLKYPRSEAKVRTYRGEGPVALAMISAGDGAAVESSIIPDLIEDEAFFQDCEQLYTSEPLIRQGETAIRSPEP